MAKKKKTKAAAARVAAAPSAEVMRRPESPR